MNPKMNPKTDLKINGISREIEIENCCATSTTEFDYAFRHEMFAKAVSEAEYKLGEPEYLSKKGAREIYSLLMAGYGIVRSYLPFIMWGRSHPIWMDFSLANSEAQVFSDCLREVAEAEMVEDTLAEEWAWERLKKQYERVRLPLRRIEKLLANETTI